MVSFEYFVARRHLLSHKRTGFISFISALSVVGVAIGVASLVLNLAIVNGFETEIREKIVGFDAHVRVRLFHSVPMEEYAATAEVIAGVGGVRAVYPYISREAIARSRTNMDGILLEGVVPEDETYREQVGKFLTEGNKLPAKYRFERGVPPPIVLGAKLASRLDVGEGDTLTLLVMEGVPGPFNLPDVMAFKVSGVFNTGMMMYDNVLVYVPLEASQMLFRYGQSVTGMKIFGEKFEGAEELAANIREALGGYPYLTITWQDMHSNLFKWLDTQKLPLLAVFGFIAVVAIFNITSTLIMIVIEKTRDIGVLKAMGLATRRVMRLFLIEGFAIGLAGSALGVALAYSLAWVQETYKIIALDPDVYFMDALPVLIKSKYFLVTGGVALLICILATMYPAMKASGLLPAETLREE